MRKYHFYLSGFIFLLIVTAIFYAHGVFAQTNINHAPIITSNPSNEIVAGNTYQYTVSSSDQDNDALTYTLVNYPDGMTIDENNGNIIWIQTKIGLYNIVLQVSDQKGGYDIQAFQIAVKPSAPSLLTCSPNNRPNIISLGSKKQFFTKAYDNYGNEISSPKVIWTTDEKIGEINKDGLFTATKGGVGFVAAEFDGIKTSVGVIVKGVIASSTTEKQPTPTSTETPTTKLKVLGEKTKKANENTNKATTDLNVNIKKQEENTTEEKKEEQKAPCTNWKNWIIILILVFYAIIFIFYFRILKYKKTNWWWITPIFLTAIGLILYFKYFCRGTYVWWPWVLVGLGLVITIFFRRKSSFESGPEQNQLPF